MHARRALASSVVALGAILLLVPELAHADKKGGGDDDDPVRWGIGAKVRRSRVSKRLQEQFVERSAGPGQQDGVGIDFTRYRGGLEVAIGFGFDPLDGADGYYIEQGGEATTPGDVSYVEFDHLMWFTAEVTVTQHVKLHKLLYLRFGAGIGAGLVRGEARKTDVVCASDDLERDCVPDLTGDVDAPAGIPPVLPVVNVLVGLQLRLGEKVRLNVDAGVHTVPYVGVGATLYLWK